MSISTVSARANWRHIYRNTRLIRDALGVAEKDRGPLATALVGLHHALPKRLCSVATGAAIMGRTCARRRGDLLGIFPITDIPLHRYRLAAPAPRLPA